MNELFNKDRELTFCGIIILSIKMEKPSRFKPWKVLEWAVSFRTGFNVPVLYEISYSKSNRGWAACRINVRTI